MGDAIVSASAVEQHFSALAETISELFAVVCEHFFGDTSGLINSLPDRAFTPIPGLPPLLTELPTGCPFRPRCARAIPECRQHPLLAEHAAEHPVACHRPCPTS
jgi:oligopeptide/dipeptide ABC transporter ATP-binding protein